MNKIKNALIRFTYGRYITYGADTLHKFLQWTLITLIVVNIFFGGNLIFSSIVWMLLIYQTYRLLSKNIYKRRQENAKFVQIIKPLSKRIGLFKKSRKDKTHKYFLCPKCGQSVRVPKGKGKITIACPKCHEKFSKRS